MMSSLRCFFPGRGVWTLSALLLAVTLLSGCNSLLRREALNAMAQDDLATADKKLRQAVVADPGDYRAHWYLAEVRLRQNKPLEAQQLLGQALTQHPDGPDTPKLLDLMAEALYQQHEPGLLTTFLNDTASRRKTLTDFTRLANYLAELGDSDGVNLAYRKACKFAATNDERPYLAAADYYEAIGDRDHAAIYLRHAYYILPGDLTIQDRLRKLGIVPGPTVALPPISE